MVLIPREVSGSYYMWGIADFTSLEVILDGMVQFLERRSGGMVLFLERCMGGMVQSLERRRGGMV